MNSHRKKRNYIRQRQRTDRVIRIVKRDTTKEVVYKNKVLRNLFRVNRWIETNPAIRLCSILGAVIAFGVIVATGAQIMIELQEQKEEREFRKESRIADARTNLFRSVSGDTGKGRSLSFLFESGVSLDDLLLDCRTFGAASNSSKGCVPTVTFSDLRLVTNRNTLALISGFQLKGVKLERPVLRGLSFVNHVFEAVSVNRGLFEKVSFLEIEPQYLVCKSCLFVEAKIPLSWIGLDSRIVGGQLRIDERDLSKNFGRKTEDWKRNNGMESISYSLAPKLYPSRLPRFVFHGGARENVRKIAEFFSYCKPELDLTIVNTQISLFSRKVEDESSYELVSQNNRCFSFDDYPQPLSIKVELVPEFVEKPVIVGNAAWHKKNSYSKPTELESR